MTNEKPIRNSKCLGQPFHKDSENSRFNPKLIKSVVEAVENLKGQKLCESEALEIPNTQTQVDDAELNRTQLNLVAAEKDLKKQEKFKVSRVS